MKLLGKVLLLTLITLNLYAAKAYVTKEKIVMGERVVLVLQASGKDILFPELRFVGGFEITSTGMQQSIEYINGNVNKKIEKHYEFLPTKSIDIESFKVVVDGKKEFTNSVHVEVEKSTVKNSKFSLEMKAKKINVFQFEAVPLEFVFKRAINEEVRDLRFAPPKFDNFWVKEGKKTKPYQEGDFIVQKVNFFLFPQKSGEFELTPAQVQVGIKTRSRDIFNMLTNQLIWKSVFSNKLNLNVKSLEGTNLYGNFNIEAKIDKKSINANEGVNLTLKINGNGNFDDVEAFNLTIDETNIYADKPIVKSDVVEDKVIGEFIQKFSISSSSDFIIPSMKLTYFDANLQQLVTKQTKPISINVKNNTLEKSIQISPQKNMLEQKVLKIEVINYTYIILAFFTGIFVTFCIFLIFWFLRKKEYKLPKFKNDKELLKLMLKQRGKSQEIDEQILALEENLYANGKNKIDKKVLTRFYEE